MAKWKVADYSSEEEWGGRMRPADAYCSKCHSYTSYATPFCPYCGDKMGNIGEVNRELCEIKSKNYRKIW